MRKSEKKTIATLVTIFFIISIILFSASITFSAIVQEFKTLDIQLTVANHLGFNVDTDRLYMGTVFRGNTASRKVLIENKEYEKSIARLKVFGELKDWTTVSENNFILKKGESKIIEITVNVPENAQLKDYNSRLILTFTRF